MTFHPGQSGQSESHTVGPGPGGSATARAEPDDSDARLARSHSAQGLGPGPGAPRHGSGPVRPAAKQGRGPGTDVQPAHAATAGARPGGYRWTGASSRATRRVTHRAANGLGPDWSEEQDVACRTNSVAQTYGESGRHGPRGLWARQVWGTPIPVTWVTSCRSWLGLF